MSVSQKLMKPGGFDLALVNSTPKHIREDLVEKGYLVITPTWIDVRGVSDSSILSLARYSGVVQEVAPFNLSGDGLAALLGDGDGLGPVIDPVAQTAATLSSWISAIFSASNPNGITAGTITNTGTTLTHSMDLLLVRAAVDYVCAAVGAEWRINPNGTLDAAAPATLFSSYTTPTTIVVRKDGGKDYNITGLTVDLLTEQINARQWNGSVLLIGEGEGQSWVEATANIGVNPYVGFAGVGLDMTRLVDSPSTESANASALATSTLNLYSSARREVSLSTDTYDIGRYVKPGDTIWVHDPDRGLFDTANQVPYRGNTLTPIRQRVFGYQWPIQRGMGVYYRTGAGVYTDLTPYVEWETGSTTYEVGAPDRPVDPDIIIPSSMTGPKTNHALLERRSRGNWTAYTPTFTSTGTPPVIGTGGSTTGRYIQRGNTVEVQVLVQWGSSGNTFGTGAYLISPPVTPEGSLNAHLGTAYLDDATNVPSVGLWLESGAIATDGGGLVSSTVPFTWANTDSFRINGTYEAA